MACDESLVDRSPESHTLSVLMKLMRCEVHVRVEDCSWFKEQDGVNGFLDSSYEQNCSRLEPSVNILNAVR